MIPENLDVVIEERMRDNALIKVIGVGGGGCNAVKNMIERGINGVDIISVNTDVVALNSNPAPIKIQIGKQLTKGLGAGANPEVGRKSAEENRAEIEDILKGADMVIVTAGMGGGTGTGAAPVIASIAKSIGALVIGIVTKPFQWEGPARMRNAEAGIAELKQHVDSLIVIPNQRIASLADKKITIKEAFNKPNEVLYLATVGITSIINEEGFINVDFADVKRVMYQSGNALLGVGTASGENRATKAAQMAISSPLLEGINIKGAKNLLLNITVGEDFSFDELEEGNKVIRDAAGDGVDMIFGVTFKNDMTDQVTYTLVATGFDKKENKSSAPIITPKTHKQDHGMQAQGSLFPIENNNVLENQVINFTTRNSSSIKPIPVAEEISYNPEDLEKPAIERFKKDRTNHLNISSANTINFSSNISDSQPEDSAFLRQILD